MPPSPDTLRCDLCHRDVPPNMITLHHLLPRQKGGQAEHRVPLCRPCHKQIHATFDNTELARDYLTLESLRHAPAMQPFLKWIRKQNPGRNFRTVTSNAHPGSRYRRRC